jgi:hypothetical protein
MRRLCLIAVAFEAVIVAALRPAAAGPTVIEGAFTETHRRLGCDCQPVEWTRRFRITLSGRNAVHEEWTAQSNRNQTLSNEADRELGKSVGRGTWRVVGPKRLERTMSFPQHQMSMVIMTRGNNCDLRVEYRLKPGFSDTLGRRTDTGEQAHFSLPQVLAQSCQIH